MSTRTHKGPNPKNQDSQKVAVTVLDGRIQNTINIIDSKPHAKYIRYLLSKRYSPRQIKNELQRLALSAPHEKALKAYYFAVMDPVIKTLGLGKLYSDYKNKLLRTDNIKGDFVNYLLKFRLELDRSLEDQVSFCKFVQEMDIEECWSHEVLGFYGTVANIPEDENGNRIIKTPNFRGTVPEKILMSEKRYLIDKFVLENVPDARISAYARTELKIPITDGDVSYYKKVFFNLRTKGFDEKIQALESEKTSLESFIEVIASDNEMEASERALIRRQTNDRIRELEDSIKTLNMLFSESVNGQLRTENESIEQIFLDVLHRTHNRFKQLDRSQDRDVVEPIFKTVRILAMAADKLEALKKHDDSGNEDKHSQTELLQLYKARVDEAYDEQDVKLVNPPGGDEDAEGILGLDEIGMIPGGEEETDE